MSEYTQECSRCGKPAGGKFCGSCGAALSQATCPSCSTAQRAGTRFCHICGTPLGRRQRPATRSATAIRIAAAAGALVVVVLVAVRFIGSPQSADRVPTGPASAPVTVPDISQMTPRERADRLFDRIVRAAEAGDTAQVMQFQPMALSAYAMLGQQDSDSRYHVGLIHSLAGNFAAARAQLDSLRAIEPDHLLGAMLAFTIAELTEDADGREQAYRVFLEAYDAEMALQKADYVAHEPAIQSFLTVARRELGANN